MRNSSLKIIPEQVDKVIGGILVQVDRAAQRIQINLVLLGDIRNLQGQIDFRLTITHFRLHVENSGDLIPVDTIFVGVRGFRFPFPA